MASLSAKSLFDCSGLVAVVTGGGTGIGLIMTKALVANGATVYILGRRLSKLESARDASPTGNSEYAGSIIPVECDISSKESLAAAAAFVASNTGFVNLVIANAGILGPNNNAMLPGVAELSIKDVQTHLWETPMEDVTRVFQVNVAGALYTAVAFLELLDKGNSRKNVRQTSQVLVTSSIGGFHRSWPQGGLAYNISKSAVTHLVKSLASFLIQWKIRVNGIAPGLFPSEMMASVFGDKDMTVEGALPKTMQPLGRAGRDEEMAGSTLYFASEAGAYCSGTIHLVDGGRLGLQPGATY